ncbi:glutaminase A [Aliidiomarina minuta]|nr:glutaminase A [Aliidiomarina minuta]
MDSIEDDISEYFEQVVKEEKELDHDGEVSSWMREVGKDDKSMFGICAVSTRGKVKEGANTTEKFPLESVSKALSFALALEDVGADKVFEHVGKEPRGDSFNSVAAVENEQPGIPSNPMINAGAIVCTSLIKGRNGEERYTRLRDFIRKLAGNDQLDYNHEMFAAEEKDLNRALFYFMRSHDIVSGSEEDSLLPYMKQTSIEMNCVDLARIAAVLANAGKAPGSDEQLISPENLRIVLTLMFTTGIYEASGAYAVDVGIPSKSGISGAILAVVPGRMGLSTIGPALDESGNSIAGVRMLGKLAQRWHLGSFA